jgi:hypothetical protein
MKIFVIWLLSGFIVREAMVNGVGNPTLIGGVYLFFWLAFFGVLVIRHVMNADIPESTMRYFREQREMEENRQREENRRHEEENARRMQEAYDRQRNGW